MYRISFVAGIEKELKKIPKADQKRILLKIAELETDPCPANFKALRGNLSGYSRIRVGDYRIIYQVTAEKLLILILEIGHRKNIYD